MFFLSFPVLLFLKMPASCGAANCPGQHNLNFVNGSAIVDILEVSQIAKCWREDLRRTCGSSRACPNQSDATNTLTLTPSCSSCKMSCLKMLSRPK